MENKVQELAEKIYKDGVAKAQSEADELIAKAERRSEELIAEAEARASQILSSAKSERERLQHQSVSEAQSMVESAEEALKTKVTDLVNSEAVNAGINEAFADPERLYQVVVAMAEQALSGDSAKGLEIATSDAKGLEEYFRTKAQELLKKGVIIKEIAGKPASFDITADGWNYKINVSKEAFKRYFTEFMRPRMRQLLFGEEA